MAADPVVADGVLGVVAGDDFGAAKRTELGSWSPGAIARVIADLKPEPAPKPRPIRYEITASGVMWSEDDVVTYLRAALKRYGAPLVLKHDGGAIFHSERVQALLAEYQVTELTGPRYYPRYNGKKERSVQGIKRYERAMRAQGGEPNLAARLDASIHDLNEERPRPVLGGRTAREVYDKDRALSLDRQTFARDVHINEEELRRTADSRQDMDAVRWRAVDCVRLRYRITEFRRRYRPITGRRA